VANMSIRKDLKAQPKSECYLCTLGKREAKYGDADCNGRVSVSDFSIWRGEMIKSSNGEKLESGWSTDFNCDGQVGIVDFSIWRAEMVKN